MIDPGNFLAKIKQESQEIFEKYSEIGNEISDCRNLTHDLDPALTEFTDSNEKVIENINNLIKMKREKINKVNLVNYCGIIDPTSEIDGCGRSNSIYVAKYGNSHIRKSKIINPYGALSQKYHQEMLNVQKKKLLEYTNSYIKPMDLNQLRKNQ
ncbi:unnamed protein product [Brachionus calyciflorus]|uniref:Uncharacterized protein n=1 Tax=Brachionus calyciflorus TaxID=104777 RepID=A0A813PLE6_9BILA|nr:unnamed protein product [Brachionus calyciflorus]